MATATLIAPEEEPAPSRSPDHRRTFACAECGHVLHMSGSGRHRIYFELDNERLDDPVMDRLCPNCGHSLPGRN